MNGTQATAAVGSAAVGGDAALWLYDLVLWAGYSSVEYPPPMPTSVAIGISGGLLWLCLYLASWLPRRPDMTKLAILPLLALLLGACASNDPQRELLAELGVEVAAIRYIEDAPDSERADRAERIKAAMAGIEMALAADEIATVDALNERLLSLVDTANPTERAFLRAAVAVAIDDLNLALPGGNLLDPAARERVLIYTAAVTRAAGGALAA